MTTLLLHGFTGSPASFDKLSLPRHERVLRPALVGHASNTSVASGFREEVLKLAAYVRAEDAADLHVIGYSLGARLALALTLEAPELVRRLTLIGGSAGIDDPEQRHARVVADDSMAALLRCQGIDAFLERWLAQPTLSSQHALPAPLRADKFVERNSHDPHTLAVALAALSKGRMPSYWPRLGELAVPTTLIVGARDAKFVAEAHAMAKEIRDANVIVIDDAGHDVVLEKPAELSALLFPNEAAA
jgi:2-succinyl-6-hydroxy-2,4-cyclohexadiene-1-carboxylate synthase